MKKPIYKRWWFILIVVILILAAIGSMIEEEPVTDEQDSSSEVSNETNDNNKEETQEDADKEKEAPVAEGTPAEKATAFINDEFGETNTDKERIVSIGENNEAFEIVLNGDENFTTNMMRTGMLSKSADIFEEVSRYEDITTNDISIGWMMPLIDQYGNASDQRVLNIRLSKETLAKINWDNFNYDNFEGIAETYFIHPSLQGE